MNFNSETNSPNFQYCITVIQHYSNCITDECNYKLVSHISVYLSEHLFFRFKPKRSTKTLSRIFGSYLGLNRILTASFQIN